MSFYEDTEDFLVIRQCEFGDDNLDTKELDDYRQWVKGFEDNTDEEFDDEEEDEESGFLGKGFDIDIADKRIILNKEGEKYEEPVSIQFPSPESPISDAYSCIIPKKAFGKTRYAYGGGILQHCTSSTTGVDPFQRNSLEASIWNRGKYGQRGCLVYPEIDIVKMVLEMLLGFQSDLFEIKEEEKLVSTPVSPEYQARPSISIPVKVVTLKSISATLRTSSLSNTTVMNMLNEMRQLGGWLVSCRDCVCSDEGTSTYDDNFESQKNCLVNVIGQIDAELAQLDQLCLRQKREGTAVGCEASSAPREDIQKCVQATCLFSTSSILGSVQQNVSSMECAVGIANELSLIKLHCILLGWRSLLSPLYSWVITMRLIQKLDTMAASANETGKRGLNHSSISNPLCEVILNRSELVNVFLSEMYQVVSRHNLTRVNELTSSRTGESRSRTKGNSDLDLRLPAVPHQDMFAIFIQNAFVDLLGSYLLEAMVHAPSNDSLLRNSSPICEWENSHERHSAPLFVRCVLSMFHRNRIDVNIASYGSAGTEPAQRQSSKGNYDVKQTLKELIRQCKPVFSSNSEVDSRSLIVFGNQENSRQMLSAMRASEFHEDASDNSWSAYTWKHHIAFSGTRQSVTSSNPQLRLGALLQFYVDSYLLHRDHVSATVISGSKQLLTIRPLTDLILYPWQEGCDVGTDSTSGDIAATQNLRSVVFDALDTHNALAALASKVSDHPGNTATLPETKETVPYKKRRYLPFFIGMVQDVTIPLMKCLWCKQAESTRTLVDDYQLSAQVEFCKNVFCLGDHLIFQSLRDLLHLSSNDKFAGIAWGSVSGNSREGREEASGLEDIPSHGDIDVRISETNKQSGKIREISRSSDSYAWWSVGQAIAAMVDASSPNKKQIILLDVRFDHLKSAEIQHSATPPIMSAAEMICISLAYSPPLNVVITDSHFNQYNKILQFMLPMLVLKWAAESIWKETMLLTGLQFAKDQKNTSTRGKPDKIDSFRVEPQVQVDPDLLNLEKHLKTARRDACAGLQLVLHAINSIYALYMGFVHDWIYPKCWLGSSDSFPQGSMLILQKHDALLEAIHAIVAMFQECVAIVVKRGFAAVAVLHAASKFLSVPLHSSGQSAINNATSLSIAKLRNEASHLRRAESAVMSFRVSLQLLIRQVQDEVDSRDETPTTTTKNMNFQDSRKALKSQFAKGLLERLLGISH